MARRVRAPARARAALITIRGVRVWLAIGAVGAAVLLTARGAEPDTAVQAKTSTTVVPDPTTTAAAPVATSPTTVPLPADCSTLSVRDAVSRGIESEGLRSHMLTCDGQWMAVNTYTDACGAGHDADDGCTGNLHIAYFANRAGVWQVFGFDDCAAAREAEPAMPESICALDDGLR